MVSNGSALRFRLKVVSGRSEGELVELDEDSKVLLVDNREGKRSDDVAEEAPSRVDVGFRAELNRGEDERRLDDCLLAALPDRSRLVVFNVDDVGRLAPLSSTLLLFNWLAVDVSSELVVDNSDEGNNVFFESAIISHLRDSSLLATFE